MSTYQLRHLGSGLGFWCLILVSTPVVLAQEGKTPGLQCALPACIQTALERHPDLQALGAKKSAAQARTGFEAAQWRPLLYGRGQLGYIKGTPSIANEGLRNREISEGFAAGEAIIELPVVRHGKFWGQETPQFQQAHHEITAAENEQQTRREQLAYGVTTAYVTVLKQQEMVQGQEEIVRLTEVLRQGSAAKFAQGLLSRHDLLMAEVLLANAQRDLTVSRSALLQSKRELGRAMGFSAGMAVEALDGVGLPPLEAPLPTLEALVALAHTHRFELRTQEAQRQIKEAEVARVRGEQRPSVDLSAGYEAESLFDERVFTQWRVFATVVVPLWDFGRNAYKVEAAQAAVHEEEHKGDSLKLQITGEVQEAYTQIVDLKAQLALLATQIAQAAEAVKLRQGQVEQRLASPATVAEAQIALLKAESSKAAMRYDILLAFRKLALVTSGLQGTTP